MNGGSLKQERTHPSGHLLPVTFSKKPTIS